MSIVSVTDSFIMLRAHCHKGTTHLPTTSIIRKYELLFLNSLWSRFILICQRKECQAIVTVDEADVEITLSIPTNLESFSQVPVFHGITFTKSPRPPYSTLVGLLPRPLPTIVHEKWGSGKGTQGRGNTEQVSGGRGTLGQGYPGQKHQAWELLSNRLFCCLIAHHKILGNPMLKYWNVFQVYESFSKVWLTEIGQRSRLGTIKQLSGVA